MGEAWCLCSTCLRILRNPACGSLRCCSCSIFLVDFLHPAWVADFGIKPINTMKLGRFPPAGRHRAHQVLLARTHALFARLALGFPESRLFRCRKAQGRDSFSTNWQEIPGICEVLGRVCLPQALETRKNHVNNPNLEQTLVKFLKKNHNMIPAISCEDDLQRSMPGFASFSGCSSFFHVALLEAVSSCQKKVD